MTSEEFSLLVKNIVLIFEEITQKLIAIQELFEENCQTSDEEVYLLFELGAVLITVKEYEAAIASFDQTLKIDLNYDFA
ncbi:MAG: hypothetical protein CLLPBCKN_006877 [Chroococcidiopsis cubana SAG 39.79]|uniref:Tetratricopeptide repeat protein n=1 Tax=Chroococcidiopsis cubana SAG 39.79 TaxID=388085 RepID=A0AB37UIL8_9CYAN|nr:hypothetical protein [Chroococcidiopsis cubana]MDZ4877442.1 hypothetical protein [Chroococcidiopsis cubana SAG 39.79]PSB65834.1 hypothetical protein C7B79_03715 [Chroococcidiopsis cubana CCALA 043]RUT11220.1 hypothetical protein DSM107010_34890 [Chroococcidiopsis cubana SAG 39.79]